MSRSSLHQRTAEEEGALDELRKVVVCALGGQRARVHLFGSWASGTQHPASEIDFAVEAPAPIPALQSWRDCANRSRMQPQRS